MLDANLIKRCIYDTPLALTSLPSHLINEVNNLIPYDTGIEVECSPKHTITSKIYEEARNIPNIKDVELTTFEQRFRLPKGINGLITLYHVSLFLKEHFGLNPDSGNHYHTDLTDVWEELDIQQILTEELKNLLLEELDTWEYKGKYNRRDIVMTISSKSTWLTFNRIKTMEVRIGEMTFDYSLLAKRILHCQYLNKMIRASIGYKGINVEIYRQKLAELSKEREELNLDEVKSVINQRIIRI